MSPGLEYRTALCRAWRGEVTLSSPQHLGQALLSLRGTRSLFLAFPAHQESCQAPAPRQYAETAPRSATVPVSSWHWDTTARTQQASAAPQHFPSNQHPLPIQGLHQAPGTGHSQGAAFCQSDGTPCHRGAPCSICGHRSSWWPPATSDRLPSPTKGTRVTLPLRRPRFAVAAHFHQY